VDSEVYHLIGFQSLTAVVSAGVAIVLVIMGADALNFVPLFIIMVGNILDAWENRGMFYMKMSALE